MSRVPRSARPPLSREGILKSALEIIDRDGLDAFSFRKLAAVIGADPMAAYYYFPSKAALFDGIVETVYREISAAQTVDTMAARDRVLEAAHAMRRAFIRHPRVLPLVATRPAATAEMAPLIEGFLRDLDAAGVSDDRALDVIMCITVFVIGHALAQVGEPHGGASEQGHVALVKAAKRFPRLAAAIAANLEYDPDAQFQLGIVALVDGLLATGAGPGRGVQRRDGSAT
jgi:TetR/AcrR family transcriptional regulator, tetracycline repressor protein